MNLLNSLFTPKLLKSIKREGGEVVYRSKRPMDWLHYRNGRDLTKSEINSFKRLAAKGKIINSNRFDEIEMIDVGGRKSILRFPIYIINEQ